MATIKELMPYLEQGFIAIDTQSPNRMGPAYLHPQKQADGTIAFEWTAYEGESEWSGPTIHSKEHVLTWRSDNWGIECSTFPGHGSFFGLDDLEAIEKAIAENRAYKALDFIPPKAAQEGA